MNCGRHQRQPNMINMGAIQPRIIELIKKIILKFFPNRRQIASKDQILNAVTRYYLDSPDFNGISAGQLTRVLKIDWPEVIKHVIDLVDSDLIGLIFSGDDLNQNIIRTGFRPTNEQIEMLSIESVPLACIYPRPKHLLNIVDSSLFESEPYKLALALGEPQLAFRSFDLSILEIYRNDPRYRYKNDDIRGSIVIQDSYYNSPDLESRDKVLLNSFGFSYDDEYNRGVAVFLRTLCDLSSEHQQIWKSKELPQGYKLHPDYYRNTVQGGWSDRVPICSAFLKELYIINQMASAMGRPPFFRDDFGKHSEERPRRFHFLVRPTLDELNDFILLFDKMLSDNINKKFFQNEVSYETEIQRKDGRVQVCNKGTLQILDDWVRKFFKPYDWNAWDVSIASLRKVRKMRQKPAHVINKDQFSQDYFKQQRELIIEAYTAIRTLRLLLENHPKVRIANIVIPNSIKEGLIWDI